MTTAFKSRSKASTKIVQIIARYQIKANGHVVYLVRSHKGETTYCTTIINGKATGCTCPAMKPCYHMVQLEAREAQRHVLKQAEYQLLEDVGTACFPQVRVPGGEWSNILTTEGKPVRMFGSFGATSWLNEYARVAAQGEVQVIHRPAEDGHFSNVYEVLTPEEMEYEEWKRANGCDAPMTREDYARCFDPCGMDV